MSPRTELAHGCVPACHGCRHRLLAADASLKQKSAYLERALEPWVGNLAPIVGPAGSQRLGYRDRVTLTARWSASDGWRFGLVRRDELIAIHDCPVHTARVRALVRALAATLPPQDRFPLAYLHVAGAQATLVVKAHAVDTHCIRTSIEAVRQAGAEGLWLHLHPSAGRKLFARSGWILLSGSRESTGPHGLLHGPTAFLQALPQLHAQAVAQAAAHLAPQAGTSVVDLYSGLGHTLREWTGSGAAALGVELSGEAVAFAARNAPLAMVLRGTCVHRLPQIREWWASRGGEHMAYVNPPRSGLEADVAEALATDLRPGRIAYLSCSAGTLARDLGVFEQGGYRVTGIHPYDFFPNTHHVEALALIERR